MQFRIQRFRGGAKSSCKLQVLIVLNGHLNSHSSFFKVSKFVMAMEMTCCKRVSSLHLRYTSSYVHLLLDIMRSKQSWGDFVICGVQYSNDEELLCSC